MSTLTRQSAQLTASTKTFNTRDAATSFLRKQGITKDLYNNFITNFRGKLVIDTALVDSHLHPTSIKQTELILNPEPLVVELAQKPTRVKASAIPTAPAKITLQRGEGLAGQIRHLILTTQMTNHEIFIHLNLPADKKTYPGWYRGQLARKAAK